MSYPAISQAVAKVVMDAKFKVIGDFEVFLSSKIEMDEDLREFFKEFKDSLKESEEKSVKAAGKKGGKVSSDTPKKKRSPSLFNIYVKDIMPKLKETHSDIQDGKKLIGFAAESWKTDPFAQFIKAKSKEFKEDDMSVLDLYAKIKTMYSESESAASEPEPEKEPKKTSSTKTKTKKGKKEKEKVVSDQEDNDAE
jgi:hypothetical protein